VQADHELDERALSGAVRAEEAEDVPAANVQAYVLAADSLAVQLGQVLGAYSQILVDVRILRKPSREDRNPGSRCAQSPGFGC
jgi:hypothetical protein